MKKIHLEKMRVENSNEVQYYLMDEEGEEIHLNQLIEKKIKINFVGKITCINCSKATKKSYGQGYCYPCTIKLAECDICVVKPELCHFDKGTCRDEEWGRKNCYIPHYIYLANSSGLKVGITRQTHLKNRWMDQGAVQAVAFLEVDSRLKSGLIEVELAKLIKDKTDWRKMLKGSTENIDLIEEVSKFQAIIDPLADKFQAKKLPLKIENFKYPVLSYPEKIVSINLDKTPIVESRLFGIKGQYLLTDAGVLNIRSHSGYWIELAWE